MSLRDTQRRAAQRKREEERKKAAEKKARDSKRTPASERKSNFDAAVEKTLKDMTPAQRAAYKKANAKSNKRAGGSSSAKPAKSTAKPAKPTAAGGKGGSSAKPQTFAQAFAAARKTQGAGGTFKWKNPKTGKTDTYSTKRADDKPAEQPTAKNAKTANARRSPAPSGSNKPAKPNKRKFQRGARMTPGERRKYEAAMERWKKKNK